MIEVTRKEYDDIIAGKCKKYTNLDLLSNEVKIVDKKPQCKRLHLRKEWGVN